MSCPSTPVLPNKCMTFTKKHSVLRLPMRMPQPREAQQPQGLPLHPSQLLRQRRLSLRNNLLVITVCNSCLRFCSDSYTQLRWPLRELRAHVKCSLSRNKLPLVAQQAGRTDRPFPHAFDSDVFAVALPSFVRMTSYMQTR